LQWMRIIRICAPLRYAKVVSYQMAGKELQNEAILLRSGAVRTERTEDQIRGCTWLAHVQTMPWTAKECQEASCAAPACSNNSLASCRHLHYKAMRQQPYQQHLHFQHQQLLAAVVTANFCLLLNRHNTQFSVKGLSLFKSGLDCIKKASSRSYMYSSSSVLQCVAVRCIEKASSRSKMYLHNMTICASSRSYMYPREASSLF